MNKFCGRNAHAEQRGGAGGAGSRGIRKDTSGQDVSWASKNRAKFQVNREGKASRGETTTTGGTRARGHEGTGRAERTGRWLTAATPHTHRGWSRSSRRSLGASKADRAHKSSPDEDGGGVLPPLCWTPILYVKSGLQSTEICGGAPARTPGLLHGARGAPGAAGRRGRIPEPLKFKSAWYSNVLKNVCEHEI